MNGKMNRDIRKRSTAVLIMFIVLWTALVGRLFYLQIIKHKEYQQIVTNNVQRKSSVSAERGEILDRNNVVLATNVSVWRVFISPSAINKSGADAAAICRGLSDLLEVDYTELYERAQKVTRADETVKKNIEKDEADKVRAFIQDNDYGKFVFIETNTKRYYPYDTLAANVLGYMGDDAGLYGIELRYNTQLKGTPGRYITAKNGLGMNMPFKYESYIEAEDGYDIVTTIDMRIQQLLEKQLKLTYEESKSAGGTMGIVMDVNTGGILAMAQYPSYDLNQPTLLNDTFQAQLDATGYTVGSAEYNTLRRELLYSSWNNRTVSWLYEPGSTFKVITASMAIEENLIDPLRTFTCRGYIRVDGYPQPIHCHKLTGHGIHVFSEMLQQSCNPTLVTVGQEIGSQRFYDYFTAYGYTGKTGVDINGEAGGLFVSRSGLNLVELSVYSFGQTFKTTPLQQITAISAVANGGKVVTPHVLDKVVDSEGNVVESYETNVKRQVISKSTSQYLSTILEEGVSGNGGAKNAYVLGYKVAAKTGTSQKRDKLNEAGESYLYVGSCVAYAPADDPQIAAIIVCDEPQGAIYGSMVAAPYLSELLEEVLPYMGIESSYNEEEEKRAHVQVWDYTGWTVDSATMNIKNQGLDYEFVGTGNTVVSQVPRGGSSILLSSGKVIFYTGDATPEENTQIKVPNVMNMTASVANRTLANAGFNIKVDGALNFDEGVGAKVVSQSLAEGTLVPKGTVITIQLRHTDGTD